MTNATELRPCDWCGKTPVLDKGYGTYALLHTCDAIRTNMGRGKKEDLIKKWNDRPSIWHEIIPSDKSTYPENFEQLLFKTDGQTHHGYYDSDGFVVYHRGGVFIGIPGRFAYIKDILKLG